MPDWTDTERDLLRRLCRHVGHCIAAPDDAVSDFKAGYETGADPDGLNYRFTATAVTGGWPGREARITYARLRRWCLAQPDGVRKQAVIHWRVWPVETRNLPELDRVALAALNADDPAPALFDLVEAGHA